MHSEGNIEMIVEVGLILWLGLRLWGENYVKMNEFVEIVDKNLVYGFLTVVLVFKFYKLFLAYQKNLKKLIQNHFLYFRNF